MDVTHAQLSLTGPVRPHNEDCLGFWAPETPELKRTVGILAAMADGVGGESGGEVASQLAIGAALSVFRQARPEASPSKLLRQMFAEANRQVHDASLQNGNGRAMSTTLTVSIFRNDELVIGHVGDCRVYLVRKDQVKRLTSDHCYVALQVKLGLLHERDAMTSPMRSMLTRSLGRDLFCRFDQCRQTLFAGDVIVQCTDGLYANVTDDEIGGVVRRYPPAEACQQLMALLERRPVDDNISVQVVRVNQVERVCIYRGATYYHEGDDAPVSNDLQPGDVLDGRFEIAELANRSGMSCIYKAVDQRSGQTVAVKVPHLQFESDAATFSRFEREEEIGKRLDHPYILKIIPVEGRKSRPYIAMEYLEGQTLAQLLQQVRPLPEPDAARIASRVCEALEHMHQRNVIHRDLKPQNIMLCNDGAIRIMDFGIAKAAQMRRITFVGFSPTMGTPDYMAPEQVRGRRGDQRTDIYSLGAILYEMATGAVPFEGESPYAIMNARVTGDPAAPRKLNSKLTPVLEEIILHALERNPANRYASAAEMKAELDDYERVPLTNRYQRLQPPELWKARFRWAPIVLFFVALNIVGFLLLFWYFSHHHGR